MTDIKQENNVIKILLVVSVIQIIGLIVVIIMLGRSDGSEQSRLRNDVTNLTKVIDSLDKHIKLDTNRISATREIVHVLDKRSEQLKQAVAKMPPNALAKTFRDSSLKYGQ